MAPYHLQFVDSIGSAPTVRLDLTLPPWSVQAEGTEFPPPELRRAAVSTLLVDGERYPAAAYGNRMLNLEIRVENLDDDATATAMQSLYRELDRPCNILRYQPGTSAPVFFRTYRCPPSDVVWNPVDKRAVVQIPAEPFAYGIKESVGPVTVFNDPSTPGTDLNSNPYFEVNSAPWTTTSGTIFRSTLQAHEGLSSLLLTPDGVAASAEVRSEMVAVAPGQRYRGTAWLRCSQTRNINVNINWYTAASSIISTTTSTVATPATTWTLADFEGDAPDTAALARLSVTLGSTPPVNHTTFIDEARIRLVGGGSGMWLDLTGVKGDVETPLRITAPIAGSLTVDDQMSVFALRRRGTPAAAPFALQAEQMSLTNDTALQANSATMSGIGSNSARTTFATFTALTERLRVGDWPLADSVDIRGRYRVFACVKKSVAGDVIDLRMGWGLAGTAGQITGPTVRVAAHTDRHLVDLGLISYPAGPDPVTDGYSGAPVPVSGQVFRLDAARTTGSGNLDWDYVLFVPADDRLAVVDWGNTQATAGNVVVVDGTSETVYPTTAAGVLYGGSPATVAGGFPVASPGVTNRLYFLRSVGSESFDLVTESTATTVEYWPRYLYVRPVAS